MVQDRRLEHRPVAVLAADGGQRELERTVAVKLIARVEGHDDVSRAATRALRGASEGRRRTLKSAGSSWAASGLRVDGPPPPPHGDDAVWKSNGSGEREVDAIGSAAVMASGGTCEEKVGRGRECR